MCATTGRSAARRRRRRCSSTRATGPASIPQRHLACYAGILQADAFGGFMAAVRPDRKPGPILEAACWSHARRKFFVLADIEANARRKAQRRTTAPVSPVALEAVRRIDALFEIERAINGLPADRRLAVRQEASRAAGRRARSVDARGTPQAVAPLRRRRRHGLHAEALGRLHPLPR